MDIRYVAQNLEWTPIMKDRVHRKIIEPLRHHLKTEDFEISVHLDTRKPRMEMWIVLQTFDGNSNIVVRREGREFCSLTNDVSNGIRLHLRKKPRTWPRFFLFERSA